MKTAGPPMAVAATVAPGCFGWIRCRGEIGGHPNVRGVAVIRIEGSMATVEHQERRYVVHVARVKAMHDEAAESPEPTPEQDPFS